MKTHQEKIYRTLPSFGNWKIKVLFWIFLGLIGSQMIFSAGSAYAFEFERRRDQFIETPGYLILPVPYAYPGIGEGIVLVGYAGNFLETKSDVILLGFNGDAEGYYFILNEVYLIDKYLYLNAGRMQISKFGIQMYEARGMETDKDDHFIYVGDRYLSIRAQATLTLFDRRFELWYAANDAEAEISDVYDANENLLLHHNNPDKTAFSSTEYGVLLDLTDDRTDPRSGLRLKSITSHHPPEDLGDPDYNVLTQSATLYIPILEDSTWVFHYFKSDAKIIDEGITDVDTIAAAKGISKCEGNTICEASFRADAQNTANANKYGTAASLGGAYWLRSYPESRYNGAHTEMVATEFRWNISTKQSQIDLYFLKDIVHALQIALFWEEGSVSETEETLGDIKRASYGMGFRFVAESGNVYRLDWATGEEGPQLTALFQYPWGESD